MPKFKEHVLWELSVTDGQALSLGKLCFSKIYWQIITNRILIKHKKMNQANKSRTMHIQNNIKGLTRACHVWDFKARGLASSPPPCCLSLCNYRKRSFSTFRFDINENHSTSERILNLKKTFVIKDEISLTFKNENRSSSIVY